MSTITVGLLAVQAQTAPPPGAGFRMMIIFAGFIAIMWFLIIAPQRKMQKKHQAMVAAVKKGDEVMTDGGIIGSVVHLTEDRLTIKSAENTRLIVARSKIARVFSSGEQA